MCGCEGGLRRWAWRAGCPRPTGQKDDLKVTTLKRTNLNIKYCVWDSDSLTEQLQNRGCLGFQQCSGRPGCLHSILWSMVSLPLLNLFKKKKSSHPQTKTIIKNPKASRKTQVRVSRNWQMPGSVWPFCHVVNGDLCSHCISFYWCVGRVKILAVFPL